MRPTVELRILGPTELRGSDGALVHSFLTGPKRLALLSYLVLARPGAFVRRDRVLLHFWPDRDQQAARNALSNMLHQIRRSLGPEALRSRGTEEVGVSPDHLWCDAVAFMEAVEAERWSEAAELYRGELLDGLHVPGGGPELEQWLDRERYRLHREHARAHRKLAEEAETRGRHANAAAHWRTLLAAAPLDPEPILRLTTALEAAGRRSQALEAARDHVHRVRRELGAEPDPRVHERVEELEGGKGPSPMTRDQPSTLAVLPFQVLGDDDGAFASGLHHDLITRLSGLSGLRVTSRSSALHFAGGKDSVSSVARALGVSAVLDGAVRHAAGRIRLTVQLVDAWEETHRWAHSFDRELTTANLLDIQAELAEQIAEHLHAQLSPGEKRRTTEWTPTEDLEAYRLIAYGRRALDARTQEGMRKAATHFRRALAQDPESAVAWIGLADALTLLHDYGYESPDAVLPRAEEAIERALELDPQLAEAHASRGLLHATRREGPEAIRSLERAVELNPSFAEAHNWLGWVSPLLDDARGGLESAQRAVELAPLSAESVVNLSLGHLTTGAFEAAVREAQRVRELEPEYSTAPFYQSLALYRLHRLDEAIAILGDLEAAWAGAGPQATLAVLHAAGGGDERARQILNRLDVRDAPFATGLVRAALGEVEDAWKALERVETWHHWPTLAVHHFYPDVWDALRGDPRWARLVAELRRSWGLGD